MHGPDAWLATIWSNHPPVGRQSPSRMTASFPVESANPRLYLAPSQVASTTGMTASLGSAGSSGTAPDAMTRTSIAADGPAESSTRSTTAARSGSDWLGIITERSKIAVPLRRLGAIILVQLSHEQESDDRRHRALERCQAEGLRDDQIDSRRRFPGGEHHLAKAGQQNDRNRRRRGFHRESELIAAHFRH